MSKFDFSLKNAPIRIKLTILSMLTTLLALSLASVVIITSRVVMEWTSHEQELAIKAGVIGAGVRAAIIFSDEDHLNRTLAALSVDNSIIAAAVYSSNGRMLASYKRPGEDTSLEPLRAQGAYFHSANLHYYEDIFLDGERVGAIYLRDNMREFFNLIRIYVLVAMLATLVGAAAGYIFWSRAQRLITDPIHSLAGAMLTVSRTQDYAIRVQYPGADEMGTMISGFNQMLGQIEERDRQLEEYSRGLESKVAVATRELRDKNDMLRAELAERLKIESALNRERELFIHGPAVAFKLRAREGWPLEYISPNIAQFGFRPGDIVSRSQKFLDLIHPNDRARFAADVAECLAGQQGSFEGEYRIMEGDRTFWLDITTVLVRDQSGALTHLDGYALDITERKLNQEKLHQTMEDLKRFNRLMSGREIRILELKAALNDLMELQGFAPKFKTTMDSEEIPLSQDTTESEPEARWPEVRVNVEAARSNQLEKTVIGINFTHPLCAAPLALARQWGIFARMGLDVSLNRVEPAGIAREFLAAGKTDLAMLPVPEILAIGAGSGGERITVRLFPLSITGAQGLVISNRRSEVKSPKDLKGMILGVPGFDTVNLHLLFHYLASHGLDPYNDLLVRETEPHLMPFYMRKGMVDGVFASEPALGGLIESKEARLFVHSSRIWPGHPCCSLGALESFHTQAPNTTAAILRAYSEAATQMNQLNEAQARYLADTLAGQDDGPGFDRGALAQAIQDLRSHSKGGQGRPGPRFVADRNGVGGVWQLMQMQRWGRLGANVEQENIIKRVWLGAELIAGQITEAQPPPETPAELKAGYTRLERSNLAAAESPPPAMEAEKILSRVEAVNLLLTEAMGFAPMRPPEVLEDGALGRLVRLAGGVTSVIRALNDSLLERKELMEQRIEERTEELFSSRKIALNMMEDAQEARQKAEDMAEELKQARYSSEIAAQDLKHTLLVSEQLRAETEKAKDMAERLAVEAAKSSEAKSEFLANMSHELRTPLNGVIGLTEMLMKSGVTTGQRKKLDMIRFSGQVLLNLVNDILDLARIEAGKMSLSSEEFSLRELVEKTTSQYALAAHEKGLEIVARLDPGLPQKVMGDPVRLNQVLANLIGNSIKFTSRGEVVVTVEPHGQGPGAVTPILFKVTDTGIGITPEQQERIFTRFTQGDPSITRKYGGAGLGVTISRQLVEMMGGKIWMESKPGEGSIFQFKIPMKAVASPAQAPEEYHMFDGKTVVIVDDNDSARGELARMAKEMGLAVTERADGASALAVIMESGSAGRQFNMAVIDQDMPRMSGTELARKIKLSGWSGGTRVILLSPVKEDLDETALPEGVDALLSKPVKEDDFTSAVKAVLLSHAPIDKSRPVENERVDRGVKILLAEDNPINQEVAIAMLTRMGHTVDVAENGALAVDMWSTGKYDLVLMDIQMPVMDGFSATSAIRARERDSQAAHTPIIAMTAHAMEGDRQKCLNAGMDDYLAKPIIYTKLAERVKAASGGGPQEPLAAPARVEQSAFTVKDVSARLGLDRDSSARLVEKFIETSEKNIISLAEAITHRNVELAYRMAHSIKGSSMQLGAYTMGALAEQLETLGRAGVLSETAQEKLAALEEAFEKVKKDLKA